MKLVVDANIVFSAIIKRQFTLSILENKLLELYAPDYLLAELRRYETLVCNKAGFSPEELDEFIRALRKRITFVPDNKIAPALPCAFAISPDPKDAAYFAVAMTVQCSLWSNDKKLKEQDSIRVLNTKEVLGLLEKNK
ncbi:MAG: PIN domain-containing protein [Candidatus Woesearchaeota archaeon]